MRCTIVAATRSSVLAGGIALGLVAPALAAEGFPGNSVYPWVTPRALVPLHPAYLLPKLSTLGTGLEFRYSHSPRFGLRLESFDYEDRREQANGLLRTELRASLRSRSLLFDWFLFEGRFRATTGIYIHRSELHATAYYEDVYFQGVSASAERINGWAHELGRRLRRAGHDEYALELDQLAARNTASVSIEGANIPLSELAIASARIRFPPYAPYIGIGWAHGDDTNRRGLFYSVDIGFMDLGQPRVEYSLNGALVDALRPYYGSELEALIAEKEDEAEEKLREYRYYPVVSVGIGYRF